MTMRHVWHAHTHTRRFMHISPGKGRKAYVISCAEPTTITARGLICWSVQFMTPEALNSRMNFSHGSTVTRPWPLVLILDNKGRRRDDTYIDRWLVQGETLWMRVIPYPLYRKEGLRSHYFHLTLSVGGFWNGWFVTSTCLVLSLPICYVRYFPTFLIPLYQIRLPPCLRSSSSK